jgi:septum formation protein
MDGSPVVLVLASASPRRRELLHQLGVAHRVQPADLDEASQAGESVEACVQRLARAKAQHVHALVADGLPVLAADTVVVLDHQLLGKPRDRDEGCDMLRRLSGRSHQVLTAVALCGDGGIDARLSASTVRFRALSDAECDCYWRSGEPVDKAGGYAVQGLAAAFIADLQGSYSGVMGLPLFETAELLQRAEVPIWNGLL